MQSAYYIFKYICGQKRYHSTSTHTIPLIFFKYNRFPVKGYVKEHWKNGYFALFFNSCLSLPHKKYYEVYIQTA